MKALYKKILPAIIICSVTSFALGNAAVTPPSAGQGGLINNPRSAQYKLNPNLYITGNVTGGKEFKGFIPYQSTTDFQAPLGSATLDSFLRDSANSNPYNRRPGITLPYYSPSKTVSSLRRDSGSGLVAPIADMNKIYRQNAIPQVQTARPYYRPLTDKPIPLLAPRLEPLKPDQAKITNILKPDLYTAAQQQQRLEKQQTLREQEPIDKDALSKLPEQIQKPIDPEKMLIKPIEPGQPREEIVPAKEYKDIFEQIKEATMPDEEAAEKPGEEKPADQELPTQELTTQQLIEKGTTIEKQAEFAPQAGLAQKIRGKHKTFASFAQDKFNSYMRLAEELMDEGKYYRAADAYSLASIFKDDDPLPYAGKSLALFAAGDYMSSSYFLNRAIEIYPEYVNIEIDLIALIGDKDKLESRIVDIKEWQQRSSSSELAFLLAYIYYQMEHYDWAKEQIELSKEYMTYVDAITSLEKAIDEKLQSAR